MYELKLFITGSTPRSKTLISDLKDLFEKNCGGNYKLTVVNVFDNPEEANEDHILATPTLIKTLPEPVRRIVGSLENEERMLAALGINSI